MFLTISLALKTMQYCFKNLLG